MKLRKILVILIAISAILSVAVDAGRVKVENKYNTVELVADLYSFNDLAASTGINISSVLQDMKKSGLNGVAVPEVTLEKLQQAGKISLSLLKDAENLYFITSNAGNTALDQYIKNLNESEKKQYGNFIVITTKDRNTYEFLKSALTKRVPADRLKTLEDNEDYAFIINEPRDLFITQGLGFDESDLKLVKSLGFDVIPRVENFNGIKDKDIENYIELLKKYDVKTVIFGGNEVLGNSEKISYAASLFKKNGITVGIIDVPMGKKLQEGMEKFTKFTGYRGAKVYGLSNGETQKYDASGIVDRWYRGILERNIRIIYIRAKVDNFKTADYNIKQNQTMIEDISRLVGKAGLKVGLAEPLQEMHQTKVIEVLLSIGVVAGGLLLLELLGFGYLQLLIIAILGLAATMLVLFSRFNDLGIKTIALAASIIFPSLGIGYFIDRCNEILEKNKGRFVLNSLKVFINSALISSIGALLIAAIMADSKYMLKLDYFRGVKFSFVLPVLFYLVYFTIKIFKVNNIKAFISNTVMILNTNIKIWHVLVAALAGVIAVVYISRTGNNPIIAPTSFELKFRNFLERTIVARPRTKEFLIGDPALILTVYAAFKKSKVWAFIMGIFASIGMLSIANTFSHIESVLSIAAERTIIGWILGVAIGIIVALILDRIIDKYIKKGALL